MSALPLDSELYEVVWSLEGGLINICEINICSQ